jgi:hypothetical protein
MDLKELQRLAELNRQASCQIALETIDTLREMIVLEQNTPRNSVAASVAASRRVTKTAGLVNIAIARFCEGEQ